MEIIKHSLHEHLLSLSRENKREDKVRCDGCNGYCDEGVMIYSCRECDFNLHESCAKLPQELDNPLLHPHLLSLYNCILHVKCNACSNICWGFNFLCAKCYVAFDVKCAFIRPAAIEEGEEEAEAVVDGTHHFSHHMHEHPLLLLQNIPARRICCRLCGGWCSDPKTYGCGLPCRFFLHASCLNLPEEIFHPFHPYHPLTLKRVKDPLTLQRIYDDDDDDDDDDDGGGGGGGGGGDDDDDDDDDVKCNACRKDNVKCNACRKDIYAYGYKYVGCFAYFCEHCNNTKTSFWLDAECASVIMPAITYEGHDHLLQFDDNLIETKKLCDALTKYCSACKSTCKSTCESYGFRCLDMHFDDSRGTDELIKYCSTCKSSKLRIFNHNITSGELIKQCRACNKSITHVSYAFRCLDLHCDFNIHLTCGPLPYTIQHKSHIHPLILTNCPIEDEKDCETDEFYCNACEEERDPFLPIYYCNECPFVAGISCVISEVVSLLKGEHGYVELRNIPFGQLGKLIHEKQEQRMIKHALTLSDIFNSFSESEKNELDDALQDAGSFRMDIRWPTITSGGWKCPEIIFNEYWAYTLFMEFVNIGIEIPTEFEDTILDQILYFKFCYKLLPEEEIVDVEDYKITRKLAPILKNLLSKYGDIGSTAHSYLSPKVKLFFLHMLCECIYSMINTKVVDITRNDLLNWWTSLEISKWAAKFRIQFAFDHLKRVALAHLGLYIEEQGSKALDKLNRDIEALKGELEALQRKRERLPSIKSSLIEKCTRETSMLKGWKAGDRVLKAGVGLL